MIYVHMWYNFLTQKNFQAGYTYSLDKLIDRKMEDFFPKKLCNNGGYLILYAISAENQFLLVYLTTKRSLRTS